MITIAQIFLRVAIASVDHILPIIFGIFFAIVIIKRGRKEQAELKKWILINRLALFISLFVLLFHLYKWYSEIYLVSRDLPLYLCSLLAILIPIFTTFRKFWIFQILVFWIIAGTLQGVLTPDIANGFPSYDYFRYWIVHLGLLTIIFYAIFVFGWKPKLKGVFISFMALQIYIVLMILINWILDANYFYLNSKPKSASLLDYMGPWPWYIVVAELVILPYFLMIYLPFYLLRHTKTISQKAD